MRDDLGLMMRMRSGRRPHAYIAHNDSRQTRLPPMTLTGVAFATAPTDTDWLLSRLSRAAKLFHLTVLRLMIDNVQRAAAL